MNILIYYDCLHETEYYGGLSLNSIAFGMLQRFIFSLSKEHNLKVLIPEKAYYQYKAIFSNDNVVLEFYRVYKDIQLFFEQVDFVTISEQEELSCFDYNYTLHEIYMLDFENKLDIAIYDKLKQMIYNKTNNFYPDMIISYPIHLNFLEKFYKGVPIFTAENAMFSKDNFPKCMYFDPIGSLDHNFLTKFSNDIKKFKISKEQNDSVVKLKKIILSEISITNDKIKIINDYKNKYRKNILVPLTWAYRLGDAYKFDKDIDVVEFVMNNVPKDIGVWFTDHPGYSSISIGNYLYYKQKFPNFVYVSKIFDFYITTVELMPYFDAIINSISQCGYWGLVFDKPVISISDHYNNLIADGTLANLEEVLANKIPCKNNMLYWYLTHYVIWNNKYNDSKFYGKYFQDKVNKYKNSGINFSFYNKIDTIENILQYFLTYKKIEIIPLKKKILRWIYYKKKTPTNVVITILGIKFSIKIKNRIPLNDIR